MDGMKPLPIFMLLSTGVVFGFKINLLYTNTWNFIRFLKYYGTNFIGLVIIGNCIISQKIANLLAHY